MYMPLRLTVLMAMALFLPRSGYTSEYVSVTCLNSLCCCCWEVLEEEEEDERDCRMTSLRRSVISLSVAFFHVYICTSLSGSRDASRYEAAL